MKRRRTFHHPIHFDSSRIHSPVDPSFFPSKELDEFHGTDEFIQNCHALITRCRNAFLDTDAALHHIAIQRPSEKQDDKACERRNAKEAMRRMSS